MSPILANTITADIGLIPGLAIIGPLYGLPLSVLAAIIERPFLTAAGLRRHAVWYSIHANVVSLLVGYLIVLALWRFTEWPYRGFFLLWPFVAVAISITVELAYLSWRAAVDCRVDVFGVIVGNVVSALACTILLVPVRVLDNPSVKAALEPYQFSLSVVLGTFCIAAVVAASIVPRLAGRSSVSKTMTATDDNVRDPAAA